MAGSAASEYRAANYSVLFSTSGQKHGHGGAGGASGDLLAELVDSDPGSCTAAGDRTAPKSARRDVALPGKEATIRGFSGTDLLIEDEASRVSDDLYAAIRPMLAVSGGRLVLLSTPWGRRGHFYEAWENGGDSWERYRVPATECPRISPEWLEEERRSLPDFIFQQEYLCEFLDTKDQYFATDLVAAALTESITPLWQRLKETI
jgi:hypothetical protein